MVQTELIRAPKKRAISKIVFINTVEGGAVDKEERREGRRGEVGKMGPRVTRERGKEKTTAT
jgi:hypothetical protein